MSWQEVTPVIKLCSCWLKNDQYCLLFTIDGFNINVFHIFLLSFDCSSSSLSDPPVKILLVWYDCPFNWSVTVVVFAILYCGPRWKYLCFEFLLRICLHSPIKQRISSQMINGRCRSIFLFAEFILILRRLSDEPCLLLHIGVGRNE